MRTLIILVAGLCGGFALHGPVVQERIRSERGALYSYKVSEQYEMSLGVDTVGRNGKLEKIEELRTHLNLPAHLGKLCAITSHGSDAVLWYRGSPDGVLRNVVLAGANTNLYRLQPFETVLSEAEILERR